MGKCLRGVIAVIALSLAPCHRRSPLMRSGRRSGIKLVEAAKRKARSSRQSPPSNELRKELEIVLKQKFGIERSWSARPAKKRQPRIAARKRPA